MKTWLRGATFFVLILAADSGFAGTPGFNLSWSQCDTSPASGDRSYLCDGQLGSPLFLQGSFRLDHDIPDFAGCSTVIDCAFASAPPDYWSLDYGQCAYPALLLVGPKATTPCATNPFDPHNTEGGYAISYPGSRTLRIRVDWATATLGTITAGALYPAFRFQLDPDQGVLNGCAGCAQPVCLVVQTMDVIGWSEEYRIVNPDQRGYVTWQGGAIGGQGCPAATPTRRATWGEVKSLYR